jgi:hypothetical protein
MSTPVSSSRHRRGGVHRHTREGIGWCGQYVLKTQDAAKFASVTHYKMGDALIPLSHQCLVDIADTGHRSRYRELHAHVCCSRFKCH